MLGLYNNKKIKLLNSIKTQIRNNRKGYYSYKKKICIIAYEGFHANVVCNIVRICNYNTNYVEVYVHQSVKNELAELLCDDAEKVNWVIIPDIDDMHIYQSVSKIIGCSRRWDMIIIPSVEYDCMKYSPIFINHKKNTELVAGIHNLNRIFSSESSDPTFWNIINKTTSFAVISNLLFDEIKKQNLTSKKVYVFPSIFYEDHKNSNYGENKKIVFVVPGIVDKARKNYDLVIETFANLEEYYNKISLIILGQATTPYGNEIINHCIRMNEKGLSVKYYKEYVPMVDFKTTMQKSDYILGPINLSYTDHGLNEFYNKTKLSGIVGDMIEYALPGIVPAELNMPSQLVSSTIFYESQEDLVEKIISLLDKDIAQKLASNALENSRKYSLEDYLL